METKLAVRPLLQTTPRGSRNEAPPFTRGKTYMDGVTIDTSNVPTTLPALNLEGKEWVFEDNDPNTGLNRTNHKVTCRIIRNYAAFNILPGRCVAPYVTNAGLCQSQTGGYTTTTAADFLGVADEYMSAAGCPQYDLFWAVVDGPSNVLSDIAAAAGNVIGLNARVVALTAVTNGAITAGRVAAQALAATTLLLADASQIQNVIGRALTAITTANTNTLLLVYVTDR